MTDVLMTVTDVLILLRGKTDQEFAEVSTSCITMQRPQLSCDKVG